MISPNVLRNLIKLTNLAFEVEHAELKIKTEMNTINSLDILVFSIFLPRRNSRYVHYLITSISYRFIGEFLNQMETNHVMLCFRFRCVGLFVHFFLLTRACIQESLLQVLDSSD